MHGEAPETMETLRAALTKAHTDSLALEHRATTAEATARALMDDAATTLAALRDAAVAEEREACARLCDAEARRFAAMVAHGNHVAGFAAEKVRDVAADIRARGSQEPPQRPETPGDVATPAPDAPSPAGGLPVAAAVVCDDTPGRARERGRLAGLDEALAILRAEAAAREGFRTLHVGKWATRASSRGRFEADEIAGNG